MAKQKFQWLRLGLMILATVAMYSAILNAIESNHYMAVGLIFISLSMARLATID